ncbi:MAG: competence/damage-inducible protein A [Spirochaetaceae bacterium]
MVALLVIGDEILAGDIREENISFMIDTLRRAGHRLGEVRIIGDEVALIAETFHELCARYDYVISAGGVGPTHDDVTLQGAAAAFGVELELNSDMKDFLADHYGEELSASAQRMAMLPKDSEIIMGGGHRWPIIKRGNAFILPGLPVALRDKIGRVARMIPASTEGWMGVLYVSCDETDLAEWLSDLQQQSPGVKIGSYPVVENGRFHTRITVKSDEREAAAAAFEKARAYFRDAGWLLSDIEPAQHLEAEA